jgi:hypothetical protein
VAARDRWSEIKTKAGGMKGWLRMLMRGDRRQFIPTVHKIKLQNEVKLESLCESASGTHSMQLSMNFKLLKFV